MVFYVHVAKGYFYEIHKVSFICVTGTSSSKIEMFFQQEPDIILNLLYLIDI